MFSPATIRDLHDRATRAARHGHRAPRPLDGPGGPREALRTAHFLGSYVPDTWVEAEAQDFADAPEEALAAVDRAVGVDNDGAHALMFVDSSGWGDEGEPALTRTQAERVADALLEWARSRGLVVGVGVVQAGQFQVYFGLYFRQRYDSDRKALRTLRKYNAARAC